MNEPLAVAHFEGNGPRNTKPFQIPDDAMWFTYRWVLSAGSGEIRISSIENPNHPLEIIAVEEAGESVFYGSGNFYFSVDTVGGWSIEVQIDDDAWSEQELSVEEPELDDDIREQSFRDPNWQPARMNFGDWYSIFAPYSEDIVAQMKTNKALNFVEDLQRGYIIDETQQIRLDLRPHSVRKISELVLELDNLMREAVPNIQDNYPMGPPTLVHPLDEQRYVKTEKQSLKVLLSISNCLRKEGSNAFFYFASGKNRIQFARTSSAFSLNQRQENQEAAAAQWEHFFGPKRAASAWFDEANRRGR